MLETVQWTDPPPDHRNSTPIGKKFDTQIEQLKANPGQWGLVRTTRSGAGWEPYVNRGCETKVRRVSEGEYNVYAMWPG